MARFLAFAAVAFLAAAPGLLPAGQDKDKVFQDLKVDGQLTNDDPKDKKIGSASKVYTVKMGKGNVYTIDMRSKQLDSYLRLEDKDGKELDEDDDSGGNLDARIVFNCTKDGEYKVICTALANGLGNFTLTVTHRLNIARSTTAHLELVGKPAFDIEADFAVNSKAAKLSDLKGKVVLLEFSDLRLDACVDAVPRWREWGEKFAAEGLILVVVTYYHCELDYPVGFDKDSGKLMKVNSSSKQSEQAALREFAAHHKMQHPLLVLSKKAALQAFNAYAVNGLPQAVIVDRKGDVRLVWVGDEKSAAALESELKKVLTAK
jgi:peroxiredoxin